MTAPKQGALPPVLDAATAGDGVPLPAPEPVYCTDPAAIAWAKADAENDARRVEWYRAQQAVAPLPAPTGERVPSPEGPPEPGDMAADLARAYSVSDKGEGLILIGIEAERARAATREAEMAADVGRLRGTNLRLAAEALRGDQEVDRLRRRLAEVERERDERGWCSARCPDGPYAGVTCSLDPGHQGEHEAYAERGARGVFDLLETWPALLTHA